MIVTGYQTLEDRDNIDEVEMDGPFACYRKNVWLGNGFYFWDTNIEWAHVWGEVSHKRFGRKYLIGSCAIIIDNLCFDLQGNMLHLQQLKEVYEVLVASPLFTGKDISVGKVIEYLKRKGIFNYKSIRSGEITNQALKVSYGGTRREHLVVNPRVQICVIEAKGVILPPFKVVYPED
ncbi:MAG: hypothetical protein COW65_09860 [Cytophagales bacterium CG18_big_fil_WC_8_21_14_2_50_42_9]|nr:MAG: hypothetical protein COW65_09860 [Cytophagales bacterium CG18_big_fil_WC_8_21_14_2_50_42_9]